MDTALKRLTVVAWPMATLGLIAVASCGGATYVKPAKAKQADPDFLRQGEYVGMMKTEDGKMKAGLQVVALGGGEFRVTGYDHGLPGAGWDGEEPTRDKGKLRDGKVRFEGKDHVAVLADQKVTVRSKGGGEPIGTLEKVRRKSPTLGKEPPDDAVVLFDGSSTEAWKGGEMTEDGLLKEGTRTKKAFGDFRLHMEFRLPYKPDANGQDRGNSGVYILNRYEVQLLDSFGLKPQKGGCGAIYGLKPPAPNMCYPPLRWQTYDIEFQAARFDDGEKVRNARMTVRHNGVVIHDDVELPHPTGSRKGDGDVRRGPILLQDHGNPVRFRNIWLVEK